MTIKRETLDELKAVLNFKKSTIEIDIMILPILSFSAIHDPSFECEPITNKNQQANTILKCHHGILGNMLQAARSEGTNDLEPVDIKPFIIDAAQAVCSTLHIFWAFLQKLF